MSNPLKGFYHEADDRVYDALCRRKRIIDDIVGYMTNFKANGVSLLQKLNTVIQEVRQIPVQNYTPTAVFILKWIMKHVGLADNISEFYNSSIEEIIQLFSKLSSDIDKKMNDMNYDLAVEEKDYNTVFDQYMKSNDNYFSVHKSLSDIQEKIDKFEADNNTSKVKKLEPDFDKMQKQLLDSEKKSYENWNNFVNSKIQVAAEEEHYMVKWEQFDREVYQIVQELLQKYSEKVLKISNDLREMSQISLNTELEQLRDQCVNIPEDENMKNFNYEPSFTKLKKKYYFDDSLPKFDFNIFQFLKPEEVFSFDLDTRTSFLMAKQNYTTKNLDEVEVKREDILKVISISDNAFTVRNERTGEIGLISNQYVKQLDSSIKIVRKVRRVYENNKKFDPRYVLVMSDPDPDSHLVKCMDADGTITYLADNVFYPE